MALPKLTEEERFAASREGVRARHERAEYKKSMKAGAVTAAQALDAPEMRRVRVDEWLRALPGIGNAKAARIMAEVGISPTRRVQGLGCRQRERLLEVLGDE